MGECDFAVREVAKKANNFSGADLQAVLYDAQLQGIHDSIKGTPCNDPEEVGGIHYDFCITSGGDTTSFQKRANVQHSAADLFELSSHVNELASRRRVKPTKRKEPVAAASAVEAGLPKLTANSLREAMER